MRRRIPFCGHLFPWTRYLPPAILLAMTVTSASPATAAPERWIGVGVTSGARSFASPMELQSEVALGARISIGVTDRVMISIDGGHSNPTRRTSGVSSSYGEVRVLAAYRFLSGPFRPYLLTGLGGQFFNFHDAPGSAGACVAAGIGAEYEVNEEWALFGEVSVDGYRARFQTFSESGEVIESTSMLTYGTGIATIGLQYRF